ncbi:MAG: transposase [Symploca sp. SIO2E6]|nr:transposase [Symploca sp. SIO2E6]
MFVNFLQYKLDRKGKVPVKVNRQFPSPKTYSMCLNVVNSLPFDVPKWSCDSCFTVHERDGNAATHITGSLFLS